MPVISASSMWNSPASRIDSGSLVPRAASSWPTCSLSRAACSRVSWPASRSTTRRSSPRRTSKMSRASSQLGLGHRGAAVAPQLHQALGRKLTQRMPHQRAADAEAFADRVLRQLGARLQRLLDDGVAQRAVDGGGAIAADLRRMLGHASRQSFGFFALQVASWDRVLTTPSRRSLADLRRRIIPIEVSCTDSPFGPWSRLLTRRLCDRP